MDARAKRRILVIAAHDLEDKEIEGMAKVVYDKKNNRYTDVDLVTCHGDIRELRIPKKNYQEIIFCAHGRHNKKEDGRTPGIALVGLNENYNGSKGEHRHIGQQSMENVAEFFARAIPFCPSLRMIKFVVCESAISPESQKLNQINRKVVHPLKGDKKSNKIVMFNRNSQRLQDAVFANDGSFKDSKELAGLSNIEILIGLIAKKFHQGDGLQRNREMYFQGINGVGFLTSDNPSVRAFDQKDLEHFKKDSFEDDYVNKYKLVPKVRVKTTFKSTNNNNQPRTPRK